MNKQQARGLLGIEDGFTPEALIAAYKAKLAYSKEKQGSAPTEGLKQKFKQMQDSLEQAHQQLTKEPQATANSSLSQTKLADLPGMGRVADSELNLEIGQTLLDRYEIKAFIAQGGMGCVYRAFDKNRNEDIAIKVMLPALMKNDIARERFLNEARLSSQLSHPNIVNVYDVQQQGDLCFLTMELLEGQDLRQVIENKQLARQAFSLEDVIDILTPICHALDYAHSYTVHRDIKPENIYLTENNTYKLMDFGIARVMSTSQRTQTGAASGTAYYMAPEQLKGAKNIDGRADQYALAVLTYELLSGDVPAGAIEPLHQLIKGISKKTSLAVQKALSPKPENRFENLTEFLTAVQGKGKGSNLSLPAIPTKGLGIAAAIIIAIVGITSLSSNGSFDSILQALKPIDREALARQKAEVARNEGVIKTIKQKLDTARRNLNSDVRDAQRNDSPDYAALEYWQHITEDNLFAGNKISELEGEFSLAESLLQQESVEQAHQSMEKVKQGYQTIWDEFTAAEDLYNVEKTATKAKQSWLDIKQQNQLGNNSQAKEAKDHYTQAKSQQRSGELKDSLSSYKQAANAYHALGKQAQTLQQARSEAQVIKTKWKTLEKNYKLKAEEPANQAIKAEQQAEQSQQTGNIKLAIQQWQQTAQHWQGALDANAQAIAKIEQRQQADAVVEKKRLAVADKYVGKMVTIPSGSFQMGSNEGKENEKPVHRVSIRSFKMSEAEITFNQWDLCVSAGGCGYKPKDEGWGRGTRPVINISYNDITQQYIPWLNKVTGQIFRLPSEAEWEYAARAGTTTSFSTGSCINTNQANYSGGTGYDKNNCSKTGVYKKQTVAIKSYIKNAFGLYDMHGNVSEWTQDCYNEYYNGAPTNGSAWIAGDCAKRGLRGGSWIHPPNILRSASRMGWALAKRRFLIGFRLTQSR